MERFVGNWNQRRDDVENDDENDGEMNELCGDVGRENIQLC